MQFASMKIALPAPLLSGNVRFWYSANSVEQFSRMIALIVPLHAGKKLWNWGDPACAMQKRDERRRIVNRPILKFYDQVEEECGTLVG